MPRYTYTVEGTAADGQTWAVEGETESSRAGDYPLVVQDALRTAFERLTQGKAVYGSPGVGCRGPYTITRTVVELRND